MKTKRKLLLYLLFLSIGIVVAVLVVLFLTSPQNYAKTGGIIIFVIFAAIVFELLVKWFPVGYYKKFKPAKARKLRVVRENKSNNSEENLQP